MLARSSLALLATAAATVALAGCTTQGANDDSSGKFQGEQRLVANTIEDLQSAASKGDQDKVCRELLARDLVARLGGARCSATADAVLKDTDAFELTVESVRISGTSATARVRADRGDRDKTSTITLVKQGTGWRVSSFGT